jgi:type IV pilus assembly protein PilC
MAWEEWFLRKARVAAKPRKRVTLDDKMAFFQQLGSLVASGAPLLEAIQLSGQQSQSQRLREILDDVAAQVAAGSPFHQALGQYENVFEPHWIAMIGTGEITGKMQQILSDLNQQIRDSQEAKRRVTGALIYPIVLLVVAALVVTVMLWFVVPTFAGMFEEMNAELPKITQSVLNASDAVENYGLYGFGGIIVAVFLLRRALRTDTGRRRIQAVLMPAPVIGDLMVQSAMYRFASNLAVLLKSGVPMLETLQALGNVFRNNPAYRDAVEHARRRVAAGRSLADSLEESGLFTAMMINAVRIGERSAQLAPVMQEIAPYYKEKMNAFLGKVAKLLEPCIIVGMGGTIAVIMLAIYIPMFEMAGKVK